MKTNTTKKIQRKIILGEQKKDFFFHADRKKTSRRTSGGWRLPKWTTHRFSTLFWAWTRSAPSPKTKRRPQKWADKSPKKDTQRSTHWNLERPHPSDDDEEENKTNNRIRKNIAGHFHGSVPFVFGQGLVLAPHPKDPSRADAIVADQTFFFLLLVGSVCRV